MQWTSKNLDVSDTDFLLYALKKFFFAKHFANYN